MKISPPQAALITGASHGIGRELAIQLTSSGWTVFGTGRDLESLKEIESKRNNFFGIQADFSNSHDLKRVSEIIHESGLPLLLNVQNASIKGPPKSLDKYSCDGIDEIMQVNLLAPMKLTALLADCMPPRSRILYLTSLPKAIRLKEGSTYCASKAGLNEVASIVRLEMEEKQIGVLSVIPGEIDNPARNSAKEILGAHLRSLVIDPQVTKKTVHPAICASFLKWLLCDLPFDDFRELDLPVSIYDEWHHMHWLKNRVKYVAVYSGSNFEFVREEL